MTNKPRGLLLIFALIVSVAGGAFAFAQTTDTTATDATATVTETTAIETSGTEQTTTEQTTTYYEDDDDDNDRGDVLACGVCAGFGLGIPILGLLISLGIAWWIYRDATARGNPQAVLWAVLGFFFNLLGLIIYLVARPQGPASGTTGTTPPPPPPRV